MTAAMKTDHGLEVLGTYSFLLGPEASWLGWSAQSLVELGPVINIQMPEGAKRQLVCRTMNLTVD